MTSSQNDDEAEHDFPYLAVTPERLRQPVQTLLAALSFMGIKDARQVRQVLDCVAVAHGFNILLYHCTDETLWDTIKGNGEENTLTAYEKQQAAAYLEELLMYGNIYADEEERLINIIEDIVADRMREAPFMKPLLKKYRRKKGKRNV